MRWRAAAPAWQPSAASRCQTFRAFGSPSYRPRLRFERRGVLAVGLEKFEGGWRGDRAAQPLPPWPHLLWARHDCCMQ